MNLDSNKAAADDERAFSPVVRADAKFFGKPPHLCVDVRFKDIEQLDALIAALTKLREFSASGFDHVHLQDLALGPSKTQTGGAEVTFWHPSVVRDESDEECVAQARGLLSALPGDPGLPLNTCSQSLPHPK